MITPRQISKQLHLVINLADCLLKVYCSDGAAMIEDALASYFLFYLKDDEGICLTEAILKFYLKLIVSLEVSYATCNPQRFSSFTAFKDRFSVI